MSAGASMQFGTEWRFSGLPKAGLWRVFRLVKKNDIFAKNDVDSFGGVAL
jgi:hypothetical protein